MKRNMMTDLLIVIILCLIVFAVCLAIYPMRKTRVEEVPVETIEPTIVQTAEETIEETQILMPAPTPKPTPITTPVSTPEPTPYVFYSENIPLSAELQTVLYDSCLENGIDIYIALGLIEYESNFQTSADNGRCYGLLQINRKYFPDNLSPADNIRYGLNYLGKLLKQYGNYPAALCSYSAGHDTGSRKYANIVISKAEKWRNLV